MRRNILHTVLILTLLLTLLCGCGTQETKKEGGYDIDYLVLVNKLHPLPEDWESKLKTEHFTNSIGDDDEEGSWEVVSFGY
ncbi:MAG: hypothetical protein IKE21_02850 [Erysipelotrichaceae bacterium]|nr:hypothetical protein [Erysipelotrichaceae bacterium]